MSDFKHDLEAMANAVTDKTRMVFVASPNNPTGMANDLCELIEFIDRLPEHVILCFDEAYAEYLTEPPDLRPMIKRGRKIVCLRTFPKFMVWAGFVSAMLMDTPIWSLCSIGCANPSMSMHLHKSGGWQLWEMWLSAIAVVKKMSGERPIDQGIEAT